MNRHADPRHAGSVEAGEVIPCFDRDLVGNFDLSPQVKKKGPVGEVDQLNPGNLPDLSYNFLDVRFIPGVDGDVA